MDFPSLTIWTNKNGEPFKGIRRDYSIINMASKERRQNIGSYRKRDPPRTALCNCTKQLLLEIREIYSFEIMFQVAIQLCTKHTEYTMDKITSKNCNLEQMIRHRPYNKSNKIFLKKKRNVRSHGLNRCHFSIMKSKSLAL